MEELLERLEKKFPDKLPVTSEGANLDILIGEQNVIRFIRGEVDFEQEKNKTSFRELQRQV